MNNTLTKITAADEAQYGSNVFDPNHSAHKMAIRAKLNKAISEAKTVEDLKPLLMLFVAETYK